jgi:hypothetical protein
MANNPNLDKLVAPYRGKRWTLSPEAASTFQHEPAPLPVRFLKEDAIKEYLKDGYVDYLQTDEFPCVDDEGEWTNNKVVPIAAVGYEETADKDDEEFLEESFAYLFYDSKRDVVIYATSDEWDFDNTLAGLEPLGLKQA